MDDYDTSEVFADDFLVPHNLPTLPDFEDFVDSFPKPRSPLGYMYSLTPPMVSKDLQDVEDARNTLPPPYEQVFTKTDPVTSSKNQVEEFQQVLDEARAALKEAYHDGCEAASDLKCAEEKPDPTRWQKRTTLRAPKPFNTQTFPLAGAMTPKLSSPHSGQLIDLN